ncbi:hypothetical protein C8T65DRAFT_671145 [Cerioporus squamosus]|nr:hypothetical protein C8T65DRAFT_671145 [Cerioporus squamosus]
MLRPTWVATLLANLFWGEISVFRANTHHRRKGANRTYALNSADLHSSFAACWIHVDCVGGYYVDREKKRR